MFRIRWSRWPATVITAPLLAIVVLAGFGVFGVSAAPPGGTDASEVIHWNQVAATTLRSFPPPNGGAAPAFQINMAMVQGAVYDAVNAIGPQQHHSYLLNTRAGARTSIDAAVATAAYDVLSHLVSTAPERAAFPGRAGLLSTLSSEYATSLDAIDDDAFKKQGIDIGHAAADAMIEAREDDGRFGPSQWVPNSNVGHWQPLVVDGVPALDPTPWAGSVTPFLLQSSSLFRTAPPPKLNSALYADEYNEVKELGRATSATRTMDQTYKAKWWQSAATFSWNEVARQLIARNGLDAAESARLLALQNLSGADAVINCWNDKYYFDFWRPWNAITSPLDDGNAATVADPTWAALITAPYPESPSGHNCLDGAHVAILRMFFGDAPSGGFQITSTFVNPGGPAVRTFATFSQPLAELIEARIWAGLHFRSADVQGQALGANVANYGAANYFQPVGH